MALSKLQIYNDALGHLGERRLAALTENREPRRALDDQWDLSIRWTLEQAPWSFATRSVAMDPTPSVQPAFGLRSAYQKPGDWLKTNAISFSEAFQPPLCHYVDESGYWFAAGGRLFVRYISVDPEWGLALSRWSPSFGDLLALRLGEKACRRITGSESMLGDLVKLRKDAIIRAKANDALNTPPVQAPVGAWVRARHQGGGSGRLGDGGSDTGGLMTPVTGGTGTPAPANCPEQVFGVDVEGS